jgi:hypothetical protein
LVVAIVAGQELQWVLSDRNRSKKITTFAPWPAKVRLRGHEWVERQATKQRPNRPPRPRRLKLVTTLHLPATRSN